MTYKIPWLPSTKAYKEELADFWEVEVLRSPNRAVSKTEITRILATGLDEIDHDGIESEHDRLADRFSEVLAELKRRQGFSAGKYPFNIDGYLLALEEEENLLKDVYLYLLLCTRLNMSDEKKQNTIDGTLLFEELSAAAARKYFGDDAESYVFGTANPGNFEEKVTTLISKIKEGGGFKNPSNPLTEKDGGIDVVAWRDFADRQPGKLIAFGQCKTGTSWTDSNYRKMEIFCDNWFYDPPLFKPLPLVFICDIFYENVNIRKVQRNLLFFNRFRILEYIDNDLDDEIQTKIRDWLEGAKGTLQQIN